MKNYKMLISYDGTRYSGWQRQKNTDESVQGKIEGVLSKMCGKKVEVNGSGRTDAGVHALGQVANFRCETEKGCGEIKDYLNRYLPRDIAVNELCEAEERFHARLNAKRKTYIYRINNSGISNVFERKYVYDMYDALDTDKMRFAAGVLCGEHDFRAFSSEKRMKKSTVRTIYEIKIEERGGETDIIITGNGFLYNMVRIIAGTLIEVGRGERSADDVKRALESGKREYAGYTAPPEGLTLLEVQY